MKHYLMDATEVLAEVSSDAKGLSSQEADKRLQQNGKNELRQPPKTPWIVRFLKQLSDPMIIILIVAAFISGIMAFIENDSFTDVIIIVIVVLLNAILGVVQESKAEKAIEALKEMTASTSKVLRDGQLHTIKSQDLVVGDVIVLEAGDAVPADCRLIEQASLKVEESALTGESVPVEKDEKAIVSQTEVSIGDRHNMVYMGSTVVYGRAKAVIVACGMDTEMGKIADVLSQAHDEQTPLQKKLAQLSKILSFVVLGICVFILAFKLIKESAFDGANFADIVLPSFMVAISLAVAAIPEGLATVVTIVLSIGVTNMSKKNAVIRKLTAVETLGCAQIICSDKTGTLTQNKMTVTDYYGDNQQLLTTAMAQCSDAVLQDGVAKGEPTECALVNYAYSLGIDKTQLQQTQPRVGEVPFDSMRKMMSTVHTADNGYIQYTKGAPDELLKISTHILKNGKAVKMTEEDRQAVLAANKQMADKALRVLACAYKPLTRLPEEYTPEKVERDLIFLGLCGMIDPVRPEVIDAIAQCRTAGIRPIMITGDHIDTAVAIALELGIITDKSQAITGSALDSLSDEQLAQDIDKYSVYARVQPEHKVRIVKAWKQRGMITAMTGDGVNDAPSIKSADIGIGMGITGTDVTKNTADMVLADDNFATIVAAVGEGRRIYDNIRKSIQYLLSSNLAEVMAIFVATIMGFTLLGPVHLLWINLITDTFPALALGMEKGESDLMQRKPRNSKDGIFADKLGIKVVTQGLFVAIITIAAYFVGHFIETGNWEITNSADGTTMAFLTMSMAEIFQGFNVRSQHRSIFLLKKQNPFMWGAMGISLLLTTAVIYLPFLSNAFGFTPISAQEYFIAMALAFAIIPLVEIQKALENAVSKRRMKKEQAQ